MPDTTVIDKPKLSELAERFVQRIQRERTACIEAQTRADTYRQRWYNVVDMIRNERKERIQADMDCQAMYYALSQLLENAVTYEVDGLTVMEVDVGLANQAAEVIAAIDEREEAQHEPVGVPASAV